ncbi:MAG TPA: hypothetical protein VNG33_09025 [Polyangiaceae bacterium]|nr:hypothetical protein [Polyangiaceae bacterium]
MPGWLGFIRDVYLRLDRRVLGVFRAALGSVLLYDLLRRFPDAALLWSSEGLLSSETLNKAPQAAHQFSLLLYLSSAASVKLAFVGMGLVFLLYTLGLFSRVMQALALVAYTSLNARNLFFEDGGTTCTILLLCWTLLLPLGDRFSLDALLRDARLPSVKQRALARAAASKPVVTLAALAILLQAAVIYWLNAAHKTGPTWRADAVHLVLWQHRVNTPFALWLSAHEPVWLSPLLSRLTRRTEYVLPALLLWPTYPTQTRSAAFLIALGLHGGIALCLTLGPFSYAMICLLWLAVPGAALDASLRRLPARGFWRLARYRARAVRALRRALPRAGATAWSPSPLWARRVGVTREVVLACMLVVEISSMLSSNQAIPAALRVAPPRWLLAYKPYLRGNQGWSMFAPDAPREDGTLVVDATTKSGRHIDPFTGNAPDSELVRRGLTPHAIALSDYFLAMRDSRNARYRRSFVRYLQKLHPENSPEAIKQVEVWWASYTPPKRGSYEPGPIRKQLLWKSRVGH